MLPPVLTYSKSSGHLKRSGAVVGRIDPAPGGFEATLYGSGRLHGRTLPELLQSVRAALTRSDSTDTTNSL